MGRQSREHRERRERREKAAAQTTNQDQKGRIFSLEQELKSLCEDAVSWSSGNLPPDMAVVPIRAFT